MTIAVVVTENVPHKLNGRLSLWLLEVRAGVFVGNISALVREMIIYQIDNLCGDGNVVLVWDKNNESGFDLKTWGQNRRIPIDFDGLKLVQFMPTEKS